ncbi:MAG: hypothetical protein O3C57_08245, partial [Verrucomicrobia bacterium]|nr:hypothetical protein [Verrucomicrobiota bacterium]
SGINYGENLGSNMTISGTVGAALEAATDGIPALAMSLQTDHGMHHAHGEVDWNAAMHFTSLFAKRMLKTPLPRDVDVLNVVLPDDATPSTPWRLTTQSRQGYFSTRFSAPHLDNTIGSAEFGVFVEEATLESDSDIRAVLIDRIVSVTPLSLNMTSRISFAPFEAALRA